MWMQAWCGWRKKGLVASVPACAWYSYPILDARFTDFGFSEKLLNVRNSFWIALLLHWPQLKNKQGMQKGCWWWRQNFGWIQRLGGPPSLLAEGIYEMGFVKPSKVQVWNTVPLPSMFLLRISRPLGGKPFNLKFLTTLHWPNLAVWGGVQKPMLKKGFLLAFPHGCFTKLGYPKKSVVPDSKLTNNLDDFGVPRFRTHILSHMPHSHYIMPTLIPILHV